MKAFEVHAGKLRCRTCKTLMTPESGKEDPPEGLRPSRDPSFYAWCPTCRERSPFYTMLHLCTCGICHKVFEQRPPDQDPGGGQQRSESRSRTSTSASRATPSPSAADDRQNRLREIAKRWHPDAHPTASPAEKQRLGKRFAEEMAKLDSDRRWEPSTYEPEQWPPPDDDWWDDLEDDDDRPFGSWQQRVHERVKSWEREQERQKNEKREAWRAYSTWSDAQPFPFAHRLGCGAITLIPVAVIVWGAFEGDIMNGVAVAMMSLFLCMALNNWRDKVHYKDKRERYEAETGRKAP